MKLIIFYTHENKNNIIILETSKLTTMNVSLEELNKKIESIENYLKALIDANLELIPNDDREDWEKEAIEERKKDEFIEWKTIEHEL